jgi:predicted nucleic acid-binding protein
MAVLILDSEALSSLAHPQQNPSRHQLVRAGLHSAARRGDPVRVPSAVLVELYRGQGHDEPIDRVLAQGFVRVVTTGALIARHAGHLLADADRGSELAVDALVVATTIRLGGGLILTHDPADLKLLSARHPAVRIVTI